MKDPLEASAHANRLRRGGLEPQMAVEVMGLAVREEADGRGGQPSSAIQLATPFRIISIANEPVKSAVTRPATAV